MIWLQSLLIGVVAAAALCLLIFMWIRYRAEIERMEDDAAHMVRTHERYWTRYDR